MARKVRDFHFVTPSCLKASASVANRRRIFPLCQLDALRDAPSDTILPAAVSYPSLPKLLHFSQGL